MPFLTCGYPSLSRFEEITQGVVAAGADVLEIGFPHSDPLADGPVIQKASHVALEQGFKVTAAFAALQRLSGLGVPLVVMCYSNVVLRYGLERFISEAASSGVAGLIVPDMIVEESDAARSLCRQHGVDFINLITPTTSSARAKDIVAASSGFIYVVSVTGTTGARTELDPNLPKMVSLLKSQSEIPVCIGFGVSSPEMAAQLSEIADGVIVGSKLLNLIDAAKAGTEQDKAIEFVRQLRQAVERKQ